jgi:hypothetical protein
LVRSDLRLDECGRSVSSCHESESAMSNQTNPKMTKDPK